MSAPRHSERIAGRRVREAERDLRERIRTVFAGRYGGLDAIDRGTDATLKSMVTRTTLPISALERGVDALEGVWRDSLRDPTTDQMHLVAAPDVKAIADAEAQSATFVVTVDGLVPTYGLRSYRRRRAHSPPPAPTRVTFKSAHMDTAASQCCVPAKRRRRAGDHIEFVPAEMRALVKILINLGPTPAKVVLTPEKCKTLRLVYMGAPDDVRERLEPARRFWEDPSSPPP